MTDVRILAEPLGGSPLSLLLQRGEADPQWLTPAPRTAEGWRSRSESRAADLDWAERWRILEPAIAATGAAAERLARVQREGGVVVTTGQQPGLFGGPIYTWSKAMSAIALADALEAATGIPTAPVFWAATDDADFAEAATTVLARTGGSEVLRSPVAPPAGTPMALAPLGDLSAQIGALRSAAGSAADPRPLDAAADAYSDPTRTTGDAFVRLLRTLLAPLGMPVIDASHPAVLSASSSVIESALKRAPEIERALRERAAAIRAAGFEPQVDDVAGLSLVFAREGGIKRRVSVDEAVSAGPGTYTPNVLLRPIVEQAILPTVSYVAGPGELAYFAQVSAVAEALGVAAPLAVPRWSCTMLEPQVRELLSRFDVEPSALVPPGALESAVARARMSPESTAALENLRATIASLPEALGDESGPLGLSAAVEGAMNSLQHRVDRLERRLVAGVKRREVSELRDVATLRSALYPFGKRQERTLNLLPILARHGLELLGEMRQAAGAHASALVEPAVQVMAERGA
jgi:uncharacterized protein YllA (UPF0747 family)